MLTSPELIATQLVPPVVLLKAPFCVPAYTVEGVDGSSARASAAIEPLKPSFAGVQAAPAASLLKTPTCVPAYTVVGACGSRSSAVTRVLERPAFTGVQVAAPS